ncbi:hypothetical protein MBLNU459_g7878t1 [Dothideomycetes sp. NU459]
MVCMSGGAIAGATIGALAGAGLFLLPILLAARHKFKKEEKKARSEEKKEKKPQAPGEVLTETVVTTTSPTGATSTTVVPAGSSAVVPAGSTAEVISLTSPAAKTAVTEDKASKPDAPTKAAK